MYARAEALKIAGAIAQLQRALVAQARAHIDTLCPGYTHLQRAQPPEISRRGTALALTPNAPYSTSRTVRGEMDETNSCVNSCGASGRIVLAGCGARTEQDKQQEDESGKRALGRESTMAMFRTLPEA
ncbi:lyase family protein, partial [Pseudenterobacter timonensis]